MITDVFFFKKDWAKPGPYDQPMVNTLRRKKDKEPAAAPDMNGSVNESSPAMTLTQAPPVLHSSLSVEERNKALIPPVKVRLYLASNQICLICAYFAHLNAPPV